VGTRYVVADYPLIAVIRDVVIIIWGILGIVALIVVIFVALGVARALKPVFKSLQTTTANVQVTTTMVSNAIVRPLIPVLSFYAGVRQGSRTIRRFIRRRRS
jgi:hypothetical protein